MESILCPRKEGRRMRGEKGDRKRGSGKKQKRRKKKTPQTQDTLAVLSPAPPLHPNLANLFYLGLWFSVNVNPEGEIMEVYHQKGDSQELLNIKKAMVAAVISKLKFSSNEGGVGNYTVDERDTSGWHTADYTTASPGNGMLQFKKVRKTETNPQPLTANRYHTKVVHVHSDTRAVHMVKIVEGVNTQFNQSAIATPYSASPTGRMTSRHNNESVPELDDQFAHFNFDAKVLTTVALLPNGPDRGEANADVTDALRRPPQSELVRDGIENRATTQTTEAKLMKVDEERACIQRTMEEDERSTKMSCFPALKKVVRSLDADETQLMMDQLFFDEETRPENASSAFGLLAVIEALGGAGHEHHQAALVQLVEEEAPRLAFVNRVLWACSAVLKPSAALFGAIETLAMVPTEQQPHPELVNLEIRDHATMELGDLISKAFHFGVITDQAENALRLLTATFDEHHAVGPPSLVHQPHVNLATNKHEYEHHRTSAVLMDALGNTAHEGLEGKFLEHATNDESHMLLRESASLALRSRKSDQAERAMLAAALTDTHKIVRQAAKMAFEHQNRSIDFEHAAQQVLDHATRRAVDDAFTSGNFSLGAELSSMRERRQRDRRGKANDLITSIIPKSWIKFLERLSFDLELTDINWSLGFGTNTIGSSIGLILVNQAHFKQDKPVKTLHERVCTPIVYECPRWTAPSTDPFPYIIC